MLWISAAGPLANILLALAGGLLLRFLFALEGTPDYHTGTARGLFILMMVMSLQINLALAIFNKKGILPPECPLSFV
jgi:hypothetical protein